MIDDGAVLAELGDSGHLTNLTSLSLGGNDLSGSIPVELGDLTNLTGLSLSNNDLSGAIPVELGDLTNLTGLSLYNNFVGFDSWSWVTSRRCCR